MPASWEHRFVDGMGSHRGKQVFQQELDQEFLVRASDDVVDSEAFAQSADGSSRDLTRSVRSDETGQLVGWAAQTCDLRMSISQPGEDGSKPCSISQRMPRRLRSDQ
jgi:hypothetical protein